VNLIEAAIEALTEQRAVNPAVVDRAIGKLREVLVLLATSEPLVVDAPARNKDLDVVATTGGKVTLETVAPLRSKDYRGGTSPASGHSSAPGAMAIPMGRTPWKKP
jgi:hypothetical protein